MATFVLVHGPMQAIWPRDRAVGPPGDHSPFYAMPERLADAPVARGEGRSIGDASGDDHARPSQ